MLLTNIKQLIGVYDSVDPKCGKNQNEVTVIHNAFLLIKDGLIADFGKMDNCNYQSSNTWDVAGLSVIPTYVDSHTHFVFAKPRSDEFQLRLQGKTYQEIAEAGGGILNSANHLLTMTEDTLFDNAVAHIEEAIRQGTGAFEIKSGYGLSIPGELKMLRVIQRLKHHFPLPIKATLLAAHALPASFSSNKSAYIDQICQELIPEVASLGLAEFIDVFCEDGYFTPEEMNRILKVGKQFGLKPKVHVNQFKSIGGIKAACENKALSVDHLEVLSSEDIDVLKNHHTIAVALPLCSAFLDIPYTPARSIINANIPLAIASDFNPGSSPSFNLNLAFSLACSQMKCTVNEAFNALTINAACALEIQDLAGSIAVGKLANLALVDLGEGLVDIPYWMGRSLIKHVMINGKIY